MRKRKPVYINGQWLIPTTKGEFAIVDADDVEKVAGHNWQLHKDGYAVNHNGLLMHRFIVKCPPDKEIDHDNRNKLDNRKGNLKIVCHSENMLNQAAVDNAQGVSFHAGQNRWKAYISFRGAQLYLGTYIEKEEAVRVRGLAVELRKLCETREELVAAIIESGHTKIGINAKRRRR